MPGAHIHQNTLGDGLVPLINKLQDIFTQAGVDNVGGDLELPQIAVVGSQSSGKSSVLEALVGRDFLPRGPDICTRRPLVLQLVHTPYQHASHHNQAPMEWGEFLHRPGEIFTEFEAIREEIECETNRGTGTNKGVSDKQIRLKICSPHVLTMTLVDLPGITRVPVGDQPADIEAIATDPLLHQARVVPHPRRVPRQHRPRQLRRPHVSRLVDPDGKRTIGVVTKLDIMDRGTDAVAYLRGEVVPLRLGYIGVVNRCQQDIAQRRSIREARASEAEFFRHHPAYAEVIDKCGTEAPGGPCPESWPITSPTFSPRSPIRSPRADPRRSASSSPWAKVGPKIRAGRAPWCSRSCTGTPRVSPNQSSGRATISPPRPSRAAPGSTSFFRISSSRAGVPRPDARDERGGHQDRDPERGGTKAVLLLPDDSFEVLVKQAVEDVGSVRQVREDRSRRARADRADADQPTGSAAVPTPGAERRGRHPGLPGGGAGSRGEHDQLAGGVPARAHQHLHPDFVGGSQALRMAQQELKRRRGASASAGTGADDDGMMSGDENDFGEDVLADVTQRNALQRKRDAKNKAKTALGRKLSGGSSVDASIDKVKDKENDVKALYSHENGVVSLKEPPGRIQASEPETDEELLQVLVTRILLGSYFAISRGVLADTVPKAVMHFLVNSVQRGLQQHLIQSLYHPNLVPSLLTEHPETEAKRLAARNKYKALSAAAAAIGAMPADLAAAGVGVGGRR